jgi:hypothetical protein
MKLFIHSKRKKLVVIIRALSFNRKVETRGIQLPGYIRKIQALRIIQKISPKFEFCPNRQLRTLKTTQWHAPEEVIN